MKLNKHVIDLLHYVVLTGGIILFFHYNGQHWIHSNYQNIIFLYATVVVTDKIVNWLSTRTIFGGGKWVTKYVGIINGK